MRIRRQLILITLLPLLVACSNISIEKCIQHATANCDGDIVSLYIGGDTIRYPKTFDMQCVYEADSIIGNWHNERGDSIGSRDYEIALQHMKYVYSSDTIPTWTEFAERYVKVEDMDFDGQKEIMISRSPYGSHFYIYKVIDSRPKLMTREPYDRIGFYESGEGGDWLNYRIDTVSMELSIDHTICDYPNNYQLVTNNKYKRDESGVLIAEKQYSIYNGNKTQIDLGVSSCHVEVVKEYKLKDIKGLLTVTLTYEGSTESPVLTNVNLNKIKDISI